MKLINDERGKSDLANKNRMFLMLIGLIIVSIIVVLMLLMLVKSKKGSEANSGLKINGQKSTIGIESILIDNGVMYFPIKDIANELGYNSYNGEYLVQTEATDKCHVVNAYESATFFENESYVYKLEADSNEKNYKKYQIEQPVRNINGKLYVSSQGLSIACNVVIKADEEKENIEIYTLDYMLQEYQEVATQKAVKLDSEVFENKKAVLKGWGIVKDNNDKYGIIDENGNEKIGIKYGKILYDEYANVFQITDSSGKVGIWKIENDEVIQKTNNAYDTITLMDKEKQLYMVSSNSKYGVITENGNYIIDIAYDAIGIDTTKFDVKSKYIMYDNLIPVKKDGKWGVFNTDGNIIIPLEYDELGCDTSKTANHKNAKSAIMVPEYGLIVFGKDGAYGLINWKGESTIAFALSAVYYVETVGEQKAYMESEGMEYDIINYLGEYEGIIQRYETSNEDDIFSDFYNANIEANEITSE